MKQAPATNLSKKRSSSRRVFSLGLAVVMASSLVHGCAKKPSATWTRIDSEFLNPPNDCRIVQYGGHDGSIVPIGKMREYGIGGVVLFMSVHNYLRNEEAWAAMITNIQEAKKAGMQVWVCDENGYPSPQAGGLVVAADPEFELRVLAQLVQGGNGPQPVRIDLPPGTEKFVRATLYPVKDGHLDYDAGIDVPVQGDSIQATGLPGQWALHAFVQQINNDEGSPGRGTMEGFGTTGHYPNLLNPAAMAKFVDLTHAEYARRLGHLTGQIDLFYTNEPHLGATWHRGGQRPGGAGYLPWVDGLPKQFKKEHGYDLMPRLPALYGGNSDEAKLVRRHFYQTVGNMFAKNFSARIGDWCAANGVLSGGHLLLEERFDTHVIEYGNFLQALGHQQAPGVDIPMPDPGNYWTYWIPKIAAAAARLNGHEMVTALIDPIVERASPTLSPKPAEMMKFFNMAYLCGVNQASSYIDWTQYSAEVYRQFNEQIGRLGVMLRGSRNASQIALYYPIESFQAAYRPTPKNYGESQNNTDCPETVLRQATFEKVIDNLFANSADFNWLDGEAVLRATIKDGRMVIGPDDYTTVIMPRVELVPLAVMKKLEEFQKADGKVLWVDSLPRLGDSPEEHEAVRTAVVEAKVITPAQVAENLGPTFPPGFRLRLDAENKNILIGRWERDGRQINYVVNNSDETLSPTLHLEGKASGSVQIYNPADGSMTPLALPGAVTLNPFSSVFLVEEG